MPFHHRLVALGALACVLPSGGAVAQTVGLITQDPGAYVGYTMFSPQSNVDVYLIDNNGELVHSWVNSANGPLAYLLDNGDIVMGVSKGTQWFPVPGNQGTLQRFDWDGNLIWEWAYSDTMKQTHHDIEPMPNGNILAIAFERKNMAECIAAGRDTGKLPDGELFPEHIIEIQPVGADSAVIVWEWHVWDHLVQDFDSTQANYGVVADHPELIDINYTRGGVNNGADWNHANSIDYNAELDQIVISVNAFEEWWIIDHGTTTAEAAGHTGGLRGKGGDILYRWGNPQAYDRGTSADQHDYRQHNVHWIESGLPGAGRMMLFNNGNGRPVATPYSSFEEVVTTVDSTGNYPDPLPGQPHGPADAAVILTGTPPDSIYSQNTSSAQRLPNGNTLVCEGARGVFWELDTSGTTLWKYVNPVNAGGPMVQNTLPTQNSVFRCFRYPPDHPAFTGRDLTPQGVLELPPVAADLTVREPLFALQQNFPNPFSPHTTIPFAMGTAASVKLEVFDVRGRRVAGLLDGRLEAGAHSVTWRPGALPSGVYQIRLRSGDQTATRQVIHLR
jgi:hypothetical protein